jgi:hypothetical protein
MNVTLRFGFAACVLGVAFAGHVSAQDRGRAAEKPAAASAQPALELAAARAKWRSAGLSSYEYGYRKFCECHPDTPPETIVTVREGQVVGVRHRPVDYAKEVPGDPERFKFYWTVDGLFDLVAAALDRGASVRVSYDGALGFPTAIYVDYDAQFIGDEVDLKLTSVNRLDAR